MDPRQAGTLTACWVTLGQWRFHRDSEGLCLSCDFCATLSLT